MGFGFHRFSRKTCSLLPYPNIQPFSRPCGILWPRLTSDSTTMYHYRCLPLQVALLPPPTYYQISQGKCIRFQFMYPLHLRCDVPYSNRAFVSLATSPTSIAPPIQFLFVGSNLCRQLLSDSTSQWTPLLLANTPYCKACSGLAPYS